MKTKQINLKELDNVSKVVLIILVVIIGYFLMFLVTGFILRPAQSPMAQMMNEMMGTSIMNFSTTNSVITNLFSLIFALGLGFLISLYLFATKTEDRKDKEYSILRRALSEDEKRILDEIKKAGEITQDSLRFRLDWSKAKISTILTNLDKKELIQRERLGKTYKVYLQK
ncbi:MAG: MarR family transcriptional regulator [Nanoarchaeota archaeon]